MARDEIQVTSVSVGTRTVARRQTHRTARGQQECTVTKKDQHAKIINYFLVLLQMVELLTITICCVCEQGKRERSKKV